MRASVDRSECVLAIESETVRGEAVGCIAWLDVTDLQQS